MWHCTLLCSKIVVEKTARVFLPSLLLCQCPQWFPAPAHPAGVKLTSLHVQMEAADIVVYITDILSIMQVECIIVTVNIAI